MHCLIVFPYFFSSIWQIRNIWSVIDPFRQNPHWRPPIISSCTGSIYIFTACLNKTLAKYSQTLIQQHHPHLAPMEVCTQKFPIMWYFIYCYHPQYATTNWGEQVVALYCTILYMWWHKDELWLDRLKINHLKRQITHVCNTKIKQKVHQFIFTLLLQYTRYTAVIFTYFYHIISILQF